MFHFRQREILFRDRKTVRRRRDRSKTASPSAPAPRRVRSRRQDVIPSKEFRAREIILSAGGLHSPAFLMRQGIGLHWSGFRHPQTQGKVERFHGSLQRALERRGTRDMSPQAWLDAYRWEHNHLRPHEALGMKTPASQWRPSKKRYDPHPPRWEYPEKAHVMKVDASGRIPLAGRDWKVGKAFIGEWVHVVALGSRRQIYYCSTLIRELDLESQHATAVARWLSNDNS